MFYHGIMVELSRLSWENELYISEVNRLTAALKAIHRVIQVTPHNPEALEIILKTTGF